MTSRALAIAPSAPQLPDVTELDMLDRIANTVSRSNFVPRAYQGKPGDIFAAALYGREYGWSLMVSLQYIQVIQGKPTLSAEAMVARIRQLGHSITAVEWTDKVCTLTGRHAATGDEETVSFSMDDAKRAGLTGQNWQKYPKAMLRARATTMLARALFADAIMGISYTPEELGSVESEPVGEVEIIRNETKPRRRKKSKNGLRCGICDGYGADDNGVECVTCEGTGAPIAKMIVESSEYEPVQADDTSELDAALHHDQGNTAWQALVSGQLQDDDLTRGYDPEQEHNYPDAFLSIDVIGHICYVMGDVGRAATIEEAISKLAATVSDSPDTRNRWALRLVAKMQENAS